MISYDNTFAVKLLAQPDQREFLRTIPAIRNLETLVGLSDLSLIDVSAHPASPTTRLSYEGVASPDLYAHLLEHLEGQQVVDSGNILEAGRQDAGQPQESERIVFGVYDNSIHVSLRVYNPGYKR